MWYDGGGSSGNDGSTSNLNTQSIVNEKPWRRGSSMVTRSINVNNTNTRLSRKSVFLGSGTFYTIVIKDEERDA
jgi:hypothetical protein